jgi:hypothetical protein
MPDFSDSRLLSGGSAAAGVVLARLLIQPVADNIIHPKALRDAPSPPNSRWRPGGAGLIAPTITGWEPIPPANAAKGYGGDWETPEWQKGVFEWEVRNEKLREENKVGLWIEGFVLVAASAFGAAAGAAVTKEDPALRKKAAGYAALGAGVVALSSMLFKAKKGTPEKVPAWGVIAGGVGASLANKSHETEKSKSIRGPNPKAGTKDRTVQESLRSLRWSVKTWGTPIALAPGIEVRLVESDESPSHLAITLRVHGKTQTRALPNGYVETRGKGSWFRDNLWRLSESGVEAFAPGIEDILSKAQAANAAVQSTKKR